MPTLATPQNDKLNALILKVEELAVLPHVVFKLLELTGREEASAGEIEAAIIVDPGFSSKVLVLANSAMFGLPRRVTSIKDAVAYLGLRTVRTIAMTVGTFDLFVGKTDKESLRRRAWWRHSIDTAVCAKWVARQTKTVNPEDAYTCGLLHLIGKTLLDRVGGRDYDLIAELIAQGVPDFMAEKKLYGCHHAEFASAAAAKWGLPADLQNALLYIDRAEPGESYAALRACTALASRIAVLSREEAVGQPLPHWAVGTLGLEDGDTEWLVKDGGEAISSAQLQI